MPVPVGSVVSDLCDSMDCTMDCSPLGSSVHGILQARILEWVAIFSSKGSSWPRDRTHVSRSSCIGRRVTANNLHSVKFCQTSLQSFSAKGSCPKSPAPFRCQASFCLGPRHGLPWPFSSWSLWKITSLLFCYMSHDLGLFPHDVRFSLCVFGRKMTCFSLQCIR